MFFQEGIQVLDKQGLHYPLHFRGHQFILCLGGKFRILDLDGDYCSQAFPCIVANRLDFMFFCQLLPFDILIEGPGHASTKASQMGSAIPLRNIVGIAVDAFLK